MITRVLVGILLFLPTLHATAHAEPKLRVYARADKAEYVLGEPVRLTVSICNLSPDTLLVSTGTSSTFFSILPPRGPVEHVAQPNDFVTTRARLAPADSLLFFLYPNAYDTKVDDVGDSRVYQGLTQAFPVAGTHVVRVACRPRASKEPVVYGMPDPSPVILSNPVTLRIRPTANRLEERVTDVLWRAQTLGRSSRKLRYLRSAKERVQHTPLVAYVDYGIARLLLERAIEYPVELRADLMEGMSILDSLYVCSPDFRHDEVTYHYVMAKFRAYLAGAGELHNARTLMGKLMRDQPELWANPDYALLANRVADTRDEVEVRLFTDKRDYVVGEPMLYRVSLVNRSERAVPVPGPDFWVGGENRFSAYLEVERPDGARELRTFPWTSSGGAPVETYRGLHLAPRDSISFGWYPVVTTAPLERWGYVLPSDPSAAFSEPGTYRVRGCFRARDDLWRLWGAGRLTMSRPVTINIRTPDERASRILGALPSRKDFWIIRRGDVSKMTLALDADPEHPLAIHLRLELADAYVRTGVTDELHVRNALALLEDARDGGSALWRDKIRIAKLEVYRRLKNENRLSQERAVEVERLIADATRDNPGLWTDHAFYWNALSALYNSYVPHRWEKRMYGRGVGPPLRSDLDEFSRVASSADVYR